MVLPTVYAESGCYEENQSAAINFSNCQKGASSNDAIAQYFLAQMYRKGEGVEKNYVKAERWYRKSAKQGNALSQFNLGWMFDMGAGVQKSTYETLKWYAKAAAQGDQHAPFNLGTMYYRGDGVGRDFVKTYYWFDIAMINGATKAKKWRDRIAKRMSDEQISEAKKLLEQWYAETEAAESTHAQPSSL